MCHEISRSNDDDNLQYRFTQVYFSYSESSEVTNQHLIFFVVTFKPINLLNK